MMPEQAPDSRHIHNQPFLFESVCDPLQPAVRMIDQVNQYHHRFHIGWHPGLLNRHLGQPRLLLDFAHPGIGGKPDPPSSELFPVKPRVGAKGGEK